MIAQRSVREPESRTAFAIAQAVDNAAAVQRPDAKVTNGDRDDGAGLRLGDGRNGLDPAEVEVLPRRERSFRAIEVGLASADGDEVLVDVVTLRLALRRSDRLVNPVLSGLAPFLTRDSGLHSGYMMAQVTAAALVSELKTLAPPSSVDTIPTSGNQEDHVSMGWTAMRKLHEVITNVRSVLAVELIEAAQGIDFRSDIAKPSPAVVAVHTRLREAVPPMPVDRYVADQIETVAALLPELVAAAESVVGPLG